ncbi:AAA family ATPase, partial [Vibrio splendidus]|uniref:AAA family ATPase n=1 Tax=Vibrio splendidus TaxID=29497 RepID=UPI0010561299
YTNKRIIVNSTGEVIILVNEKHKVKIEYLSSGEMQLLIIISNMIFCKNQNKGMIIIVDEPEISLHIRWQEILISTLRTIQKDAQLIFATHSPDIISENESYCIPLINNEWAH